jgi:hypothetical protein
MFRVSRSRCVLVWKSCLNRSNFLKSCDFENSKCHLSDWAEFIIIRQLAYGLVFILEQKHIASKPRNQVARWYNLLPKTSNSSRTSQGEITVIWNWRLTFVLIRLEQKRQSHDNCVGTTLHVAQFLMQPRDVVLVVYIAKIEINFKICNYSVFFVSTCGDVI